ncbi:MAG: NAD-dependent epimerase/dehydratase family protein [Deltaproteobacteria bacterium]|nr:NAD-dependent epimerase/dehydratase family protein [Deltaproteobacteria bacterium]
MLNESRIYLAGHTGLLGSAILKELQGRGCSKIITRTRRELQLTGQRAVDRFFKTRRPEYVFLAAGLSGGPAAETAYPADLMHVNISIQDNFFEAAQRHGVKHLVFFGSPCVYPENRPQPVKEVSLLTGEAGLPCTAYAAAKMAGLAACRAYNSQYRANRFIALVPGSIYGPKDRFAQNSHALSTLVREFHRAKVERREDVTLSGSGSEVRGFLYSGDAARAAIFAAENAGSLSNRHYNIGQGSCGTLKELAETVAGVVGFEGRTLWCKGGPGDASGRLLDGTDFGKLGWEPVTGLRDGVRMTYEWFLANEMDRSA